MKVKLIAIAALGKDRQIGLDGKLPWSIQDEHEHFIRAVAGEYVLIGRKNFELHGGMIPGAFPLVLTRDRSYTNDGALIFSDLMELLQYAEGANIDTIYVLGGSEIYALAMPLVSEFLLSEVDYDGPADTYFPDYTAYPWVKISEEYHTGWKLNRLIKVPQLDKVYYE
jgi:dihydrofolate reductase